MMQFPLPPLTDERRAEILQWIREEAERRGYQFEETALPGGGSQVRLIRPDGTVALIAAKPEIH